MQSKLGVYLIIVVLGLGGILSFHVPSLEFAGGFVAQALGPAQSFLHDPARQASDFFHTVEEMGQLRAENTRLREEVSTLRGDSARLVEANRENAQLRDQLNLKRDQPAFQWVTARVIGRDANNILRSIAIDRGSADGLSSGMTVITPAGLVGRLVVVGPHTGRVLLIMDVSSSVTAVVQGTRADGVVNGQAKSHLLMRYIPQPADLKTGDHVITSGIGGIFPHGIPIGRIGSVSKKDIELFQEAQIEPDVDFGQLENVLVITNHVPLRLE